jgi:ABC-type phosphate transport system substrate-binding protein
MRLRILIRVSCARAASLAAGVGLLLATAVMLRSPSAWSDDFVVIRNAKNPTTSITPAQAKEMAIGKRKVWAHGAVVGLVLTPVGSPELGWFASRMCSVVDSALMAKIKQEVFKGELRKPIIVSSSSDVVAAVAADEGAFGIVRADTIKAAPSGVAVLAVQ